MTIAIMKEFAIRFTAFRNIWFHPKGYWENLPFWNNIWRSILKLINL